MHPIRLLCLLASLPLLAACGSDPSPGPYLDFIAEGQLLTSTRVVNPGDTLSTRVYAQRGDSNDVRLRRFTIQVQTNFYNGPPDPEERGPALTYLDTLISGRRGFLFTNRFKASPLSARETWTYSVEDEAGQTTSRSYRLTTRLRDSVRTWLNYSARLQPPVQRTSRAALATSRGLALPPHATDNPAYQQLVDVIYLTADGGPTLAAPAAALLDNRPNLKIRNWSTRRATRFQLTTLTTANFTDLNNEVAISDAVTAANPTLSSLRVRKDQVIAFRTSDDKSGLLLVRDVSTTAPVEVTLEVKVNR